MWLPEFIQKITAFLLRSNIALRNIDRPRKCVNTNFYFSRTENTYKIRNCFSMIKIHFSQSLKQYHQLSSARSTIDSNYHSRLVFPPGASGGAKSHNFELKLPVVVAFGSLTSVCIRNAGYRVFFKLSPPKLKRYWRILRWAKNCP